LDSIRVDICAKCHPFFTGETRLLDTEGRVEKFKKKYNLK
jgi:large subunit ribosomal protein L31